MVTTLLDIVGAALVTGFAYVVWPPAALLVAGLFVLVVSFRISGRSR